MFLATGIILLIISLVIICAIAFTTARKIKVRGEIVISKKNLIYLVPTYLLIYVLHMSAWLYNGNGLDFFSGFSLLGSALEVITKFKVDTSLVLPVCEAYPVYYADFVLAYVAGGASVILSVASFFSPRIRNYFSRLRYLRRGCDIVIGYSEGSMRYLKNNKGCILLAPSMARNTYADLIRSGFTVMTCPLGSLNRFLKDVPYNLILFRDGKISYSDVTDQFIAIKKCGRKVALNMEAELNEVKIIKEKLIAEADKQVAAYINCFSRHEIVARQFVRQYPITKYIPRHFFNDNCTLKQDKEINVVFIGFGKMNYQLFRMCCMQFQFAEQEGDRLASKPVNYYIYDNRDQALHNEFLSRITYEFDEDFKDCDFPKPDRICRIAEVRQTDINSVEARRKFCEVANGNSFTYFIISLNADLEDAAYAQTLKRMLPDNAAYRIFVRNKSNAERFCDDGIIYFGEEGQIYTHGCIVNDDLSELALRINMLYDSIGNPPEWLRKIRELPPERQAEELDRCLKDERNIELMRVNWESRPMIEQASNLYHALSLPFKLNLLGFDMVKRSGKDDRGISEEQFDIRYINTGKADDYADPEFFFGTQSSNVLAFIEHSRWNALYILYDYKQMRKKDIVAKEVKDNDGNVRITAPHKDAARKRHACITTYYGLKKLISYKFKVMYGGEDISKVPPSDKRLRELYNIYRYDYMDLDRIYREITSIGYKIVDNQTRQI